MRNIALYCLAVACLGGTAQADTYGIVINPGVQTVANPTGGAGTTTAYNSPGEQGGGGYTAVTSTAPHGAAGSAGANGSLEIHGDRSRYVLGSIYENFGAGPAPSLSLLDDISQLTFDWMVTTPGSTQPHAAPAVRIHIMDNGVRSEMIWEYVYNGGTAGVTPPTGWQSSGEDSLFYVNVRDNDGVQFLNQNGNPAGLSINGGTQGEVYLNGGLYKQTINDWKSLYSSSAYITGLSYGAGSGFGSNFVGFIDNVGIQRGADSFVQNFEVGAAVPEPATWAMMISGFGLVGGAMRRRAGTLVAA